MENLRKQYSTTVYGKQYNAMQCRKVREATEERTPKTVQWTDQRASVALAGAAGGARGSRTPKEGGGRRFALPYGSSVWIREAGGRSLDPVGRNLLWNCLGAQVLRVSRWTVTSLESVSYYGTVSGLSQWTLSASEGSESLETVSSLSEVD